VNAINTKRTLEPEIVDKAASSFKSRPQFKLAVPVIDQFQNTASAGFQSDTNLNTIFSLVPGKVVSVALSSSAILAAN
jgi:hypothetical protein